MPFSVEHVSTAGGYVIHQLTAADTLRTGDRLRLHLDQVSAPPHKLHARQIPKETNGFSVGAFPS